MLIQVWLSWKALIISFSDLYNIKQANWINTDWVGEL